MCALVRQKVIAELTDKCKSQEGKMEQVKGFEAERRKYEVDLDTNISTYLHPSHHAFCADQDREAGAADLGAGDLGHGEQDRGRDQGEGRERDQDLDAAGDEDHGVDTCVDTCVAGVRGQDLPGHVSHGGLRVHTEVSGAAE